MKNRKTEPRDEFLSPDAPTPEMIQARREAAQEKEQKSQPSELYEQPKCTACGELMQAIERRRIFRPARPSATFIDARTVALQYEAISQNGTPREPAFIEFESDAKALDWAHQRGREWLCPVRLYRIPAANLTRYASRDFWPDLLPLADIPDPHEFRQAFFAWMDELNSEAVRRGYSSDDWPMPEQTAHGLNCWIEDFRKGLSLAQALDANYRPET
jgi:hypothetical protein